NMRQKIKATRTKFQDLVINGDTAVDANAFDGLDKALAGSDTEFSLGTLIDASDLDTTAGTKFTILDQSDGGLSRLDGTPTISMGSAKARAKFRAIVRRTGMYTRDPIEGLRGQGGRPIVRETYGGVLMVDPGNKAGTNDPIIPLYSRDL